MPTIPSLLFLAAAGAALASLPAAAASPEAGQGGGGSRCSGLPETLSGRRVVCADVAAFDAMLTYNRFGSYNPFGMIFALRRDLVPANRLPQAITAADCAADDGTDKALADLAPGQVRLRDCKRPRPMVLRANVGDLLVVSVENLLRPDPPGHSENFCRQAGTPAGTFASEVRAAVSEGSAGAVDRGEAACQTGSATRAPGTADAAEAEWPRTRGLNFAIQGLVAVPDPRAPGGGAAGAQAQADLRVCRGLTAIPPGQHVTCFYEIDTAAPAFLSSNAAPAGGEGDGGSITHGLFAAVVAQENGGEGQPQTEWYRSQVSQAALDRAWTPVEPDLNARLQSGDHRRSGAVDYEAAVDGIPVLNLLTPPVSGRAREIVHSDLNAIVRKGDGHSFREFSVFFHDELKTFYTRNFEELGRYGQLAGVRDGFAINYGSSGMGAILLANRKGFGPARDCVECLYEEFFLTSWANGDPALLERYADDPSNVHHSYLNDEVRFRNFHAGPKETHVFHLHAHQWFAGNDVNRGAYLDSQTVAPQQSFSYRIYGGGLDKTREPGADEPWRAPVGSGNRNRTVGDSIFHCHLYPHFAQGMWELWRVHDVLEDGSRKLPDGQADGRLSTEARAVPADSAGVRGGKRLGSVDPDTGRWIAQAQGTPVPAVVPLPDRPAPVLPTYAAPGAEPFLTAQAQAAMPGYPFYVAGAPGHRPPQAPMDLARALRPEGGPTAIAAGDYLDGGLPRHTVAGGERRPGVTVPTGTPPAQAVAKALMMGDMTAHLDSARLRLLDYEGTPLERAAMGFHHDGRRWGDGAPVAALRSDGTPAAFNPAGGYEVAAAQPGASHPPLFTVNGAPPKPGAPFADPCGAPDRLSPDALSRDPLVTWGAEFRPDPAVRGFRRYEASAVQLDMVTNRAGWHDPQARINVLTARSDGYKQPNTPLGAAAISPFISAREEPFFFRAFSGECIEFRHTNELPKELELDDFQVKTPTDTIGQHIHLVKFDVTSSDGSGNGWNYEDGTFAPDEVAARICAAKTADASVVAAARAPLEVKLREAAGLCVQKVVDGRTIWVPAQDGGIWRLKRSEHPALFQTTTQRWFADPILSRPGEAEDEADRTLRTVFSHDHFGPSSIQQHGYYTALIVEPADNDVCVQAGGECRRIGGMDAVSDGDTVTVGAQRVLIEQQAAPPQPGRGDSLHPNTREYALAIADFSVLYDPRATDADAEGAMAGGSPQGLARLACEARHRASARRLDEICGSALDRVNGVLTDAAEDAVPAWNAAGRPGGAQPGADAVTAADVTRLAAHLTDYRTRAALSAGGRMARPVAPPARPESISVDHHDPYLVNYRGEPIPLRVGTKLSSKAFHPDCALARMPRPGAPGGNDAALVADARPCSYAYHREGEAGDMSNVFLSSLHGDPATPLIETYAGELTLIRLIQGAQEVQHMFGIEGFTFRRNLDQPFPRAEPPAARQLTQKQRCDTLDAAGDGFPAHYRAWFEGRLSGVAPPIGQHFAAFQDAIARCTNLEGNVAAQEIGISEHFEFVGVFRQTFRPGVLFAPPAVATARAPEAAPPAAEPDRRRFSTDYLYGFGTQDSQWDGAWGVVRVYLDGDAPDLTTCMAATPGADPASCLSGAPISARLTPLPDSGQGVSLAARTAAPQPPETLALACDPAAPRAEAAVAAIEARRVFGPDGMSYGRSTHDPDALVLLALDPRDLAARLSRPDARNALERDLVARYRDDPVEPYVLPVLAGECVSLTIVNLLTGALPDDFGDARLPAITPLNTTPAARLVSRAGDGRRQVNELDMQPGRPWRNGLRPSSRLALQFPLPVMNENQSYAAPFGYNAKGALMPSGDRVTIRDGQGTGGQGGYLRRDATVERVTFYAGKVSAKSFDPDEIAGEVVSDLVGRLGEAGVDPALAALGGALDAGDLGLVPVADRRDFRPEDVTVGGRQYRFEPAPAGLTPAQRAELVRLAELAGAEVLARDHAHWMPYAFGALPIKSFGDVIGHPAHGLAGAVLVLPCDARVEGAGGDAALAARRCDPRRDEDPGAGEAAAPRPVLPRATPAGQAVAYAQPHVCGLEQDCGPGEAAVRHFVLFYQDGLNLWDKGSRIRWTRADGSAVTTRRALRMQPDCMICDDSYDRGDRAVSYHAAPLYDRLRPSQSGLEADSDLNGRIFPRDLWLLGGTEQAAGQGGRGPAKAATSMPVLRARAGEEVTISVVHPGGRARQRAFVTIAQDYDDLFPGFGFPHSALLGPGKAVNAALSAPVRPGCYLWHDGPTYMISNGAWGLLDVVADKDFGNATVTSCRRAP